MKKLFAVTIGIVLIAAACNKPPEVIHPVPGPTPNPAPSTSPTSFSGKLIAGGAECQLFQADDGKQYTLAGNASSYKTGDSVTITGNLAEVSTCMQGDGTIALTTITKASPNNSPTPTPASKPTPVPTPTPVQPTVINGTKGPNWTAYTGLYVNNYAKYSIQLPKDYAALEVITPVSTNNTALSIDTQENIASSIKGGSNTEFHGSGGLIEISAIQYNQPISADQERQVIACGGDKVSFDGVMFLGSVSASVCNSDSPYIQRSLFFLSDDRKIIFTILTPPDSASIAITDPILKTFKFTK